MHVLIQFLDTDSLCALKPCNQGICIKTLEEPFYQCQCAPSFTGTRCKEGETIVNLINQNLLWYNKFTTSSMSLIICFTSKFTELL